MTDSTFVRSAFAPPSLGRARAIVAAFVIAIGGLLVADAPLQGQTGTAHVQYARIDGAANTFTLGARYTKALGDAGGGGVLPGRGQTLERAGRRWLFTATAGGGLSRSTGDDPENSFTVVAQAGVLYRFESLVESLGLVAYGNLEPGFIGPAATARAFGILEVIGGAGRLEGASGVSWFAGASVSVQLFGDLGR